MEFDEQRLREQEPGQEEEFEDDPPPTPEEHEAMLAEQEMENRRIQLLRQQDQQRQERRAYFEEQERMVAFQEEQANVHEVQLFEAQQRREEEARVANLRRRREEEQPFRNAGQGARERLHGSSSSKSSDSSKARTKIRFPKLAFPVSPEEYELFLSNLNVWVSLQDGVTPWGAAVYLELPWQMQRIVASIPGLQECLGETKIVDGTSQGLSATTQQGLAWLMMQLQLRGKLRQTVVKKKMHLVLLNNADRPENVTLVDFARSYNANYLANKDAGLPGDTETLGWLLMAKLRLTAGEEANVMARIQDAVTVESVVDAVILLFAGNGQKAQVAARKGVFGEDEAAFGAAMRETFAANHNVTCFNCGKGGHYSRDCPSPRSTKPPQQPTAGGDRQRFSNNTPNSKQIPYNSSKSGAKESKWKRKYRAAMIALGGEFSSSDEEKEQRDESKDEEDTEDQAVHFSASYFSSKSENKTEKHYVYVLESKQAWTTNGLDQLAKTAFGGKRSSQAILDTGCTADMCGSRWMADYMKLLKVHGLSASVTTRRQKVNFMFGCGSRTSRMAHRIPIFPGGLKGFLWVSVVEDVTKHSIPFLLSKGTMRDVFKCVLDMPSDTVTICGRKIQLEAAKRGHYFIDLMPGSTVGQDALFAHAEQAYLAKATVDSEGVKEALKSESASAADLQKMCRAIHARFQHPGRQKSRFLLDSAGIHGKEIRKIMDNICLDCRECRSHSKPKSTPVVSFTPRAPDLNETLGIDVFYFEGIPILKIIDFATRLMTAGVLLSKSTVAVSRLLEMRWCSLFGWPKKIRLDRGTETVSEAFMKICDINKVLLEPTPAQGQAANGIVERHGAMLRTTLDKLRMEFPKEDVAVLLEKSLMAHNVLTMTDGASPSFLAFGLNPNIPELNSITAAGASAISEVPSYIPAYKKRLDIAWAARRAFLEAITCKKLIVAVQHPSRGDRPTDKIQVGDVVLFWNVSVDGKHRGWRGPARISAVDREAKTIQMSYGRHYVTRHENKVILADTVTTALFLKSPPPPPGESAHIERVDVEPFGQEDGPNPTEQQPMNPVEVEAVVTADITAARGQTPVEGSLEQADAATGPSIAQKPSATVSAPTIPKRTNPRRARVAPQKYREALVAAAAVWTGEEASIEQRDQWVADMCEEFVQEEEWAVKYLEEKGFFDPGRKGKTVRDRNKGAEPETGTDPSVKRPDNPEGLAGKDGENEGWDEGPTWEDCFSAVKMAKGKGEVSAAEAAQYKAEFDVARAAEMKKLWDKQAFKKVRITDLPEHTQVIGSRFVLTWKEVANSVKEARGRLVVLGHQEHISDGEPIDAPTGTRESLRMFMVEAVRRKWLLRRPPSFSTEQQEVHEAKHSHPTT